MNKIQIGHLVTTDHIAAQDWANKRKSYAWTLKKITELRKELKTKKCRPYYVHSIKVEVKGSAGKDLDIPGVKVRYAVTVGIYSIKSSRQLASLMHFTYDEDKGDLVKPVRGLIENYDEMLSVIKEIIDSSA